MILLMIVLSGYLALPYQPAKAETETPSADTIIEYDSTIMVGFNSVKFRISVKPTNEPGDIFTLWFRVPTEYLSGDITYTGNGFFYPKTEDGIVSELEWIVGLRVREEVLEITIPVKDYPVGTQLSGFYKWLIQNGEPAQSRDLTVILPPHKVYIVIVNTAPASSQPATGQ
jgi:hypothetical protein